MYLSNQYHFCLILSASHLMELILVLASPVSSLPSRILLLCLGKHKRTFQPEFE
ncbi:hypothetical protein BDW66DRAFT_138189 [Aspergillus desertorum]